MFPTKVPLKMECYVFTSISKIPRTSPTLIENFVSTNLPNLRALLEKNPRFWGDDLRLDLGLFGVGFASGSGGCSGRIMAHLGKLES
jgi:hypothetical protein